ncbi:hypothetical protein L1987_11231 [Smallanthus sonchifolius]|uniref:Uncharacterized protein n=1 Tax=Smallanthus sonchifolius TaxID=185202 RepID=A0ACB9JAY5_9ASTR|nr:hypothetical protein L1987_11231 [Smallanthus sonchifolius]
MMCVLFDDTATTLVAITAEDLIFKSLSDSLYMHGADDMCWIHDYLIDGLCALRAILRIKIDKYNLAPNYVRCFTLSKYMDDDIKLVAKNYTTFAIDIITLLGPNAYDCGVLEEVGEFLVMITNDEWDMANEAFRDYNSLLYNVDVDGILLFLLNTVFKYECSSFFVSHSNVFVSTAGGC